MAPAFFAVAVEQAVRRAAAQDGLEFPAEIHHVAHALAHALPQERRLLMGGVSSNEHAVLAPGGGNQRVETIAGLSPELAFVGRDPRREQSPSAFGCGERLRI